MDSTEKLRDFYESGQPKNAEIYYKGYRLHVINSLGTEVSIFNRDDTHVENFTIGAFDSFADFKDRLESLIEYNPDTMSDWLHREKE